MAQQTGNFQDIVTGLVSTVPAQGAVGVAQRGRPGQALAPLGNALAAVDGVEGHVHHEVGRGSDGLECSMTAAPEALFYDVQKKPSQLWSFLLQRL